MDTEDAPTTIMIVDDDPENLRVLSTMLARENYTIRCFPGGVPALQSSQEDPPNLILLDVRMPEMDGFEVCARLKADKNLKDIPVLFISAADEIEMKVAAFEQGGADYITKPFQADEVLSRIRTQLAITRYQKDLESLNLELEARVRRRTSDLKKTNESLKEEIKARQAAQVDLLKSEEKYRRIVTTANEAIFVTDEAFRITYTNRVAIDILGGTEEHILGQPALSFIDDKDRKAFEKRFQERKTGKKAIYESKIRRLDGKQYWVIVAASPILDSNGNFQGSVVMMTDITGRKQSEIKLKTALDEVARLKKQIEAENIYLQEEIRSHHRFDEIVGQSDELKYVLYRIEQVAPTDSTVLILGETGTGKELIARAIHGASNRAERPLVKVNCAALPDQIIESELFGHEKGAFTGAIKSREGRFELVHRGTLFLDEIGELPLSLQAKLLRVIQDGEFERLGSNRVIRTDTRLIAATNRDIRALVEEGKFRNDLWYRLNVFPISVPPLNRRKDDIPLLVNHFMQKIGKRVGKRFDKVAKQFLNEMMAYDWPGNVRELEHLLERSMIISPGKTLTSVERLPKAKKASDSKIASMADAERDHILRALEQTNWVIDGPNGAARLLDRHPNTLRYRMKKLNIRRPKHNKKDGA